MRRLRKVQKCQIRREYLRAQVRRADVGRKSVEVTLEWKYPEASETASERLTESSESPGRSASGFPDQDRKVRICRLDGWVCAFDELPSDKRPDQVRPVRCRVVVEQLVWNCGLTLHLPNSGKIDSRGSGVPSELERGLSVVDLPLYSIL